MDGDSTLFPVSIFLQLSHGSSLLLGNKAGSAAKDKQTVSLCQDIVPILYLW